MRDGSRRAFVMFAVLGLGTTCGSPSGPAPSDKPEQVAATKPNAPHPASEAARREFEILPRDYAVGTSKLYSRGAFLPLDDPRAMSEGDFIGRLRALFGPVEADSYVLRHRETGFIVTAYSAQSGPSYGGGPRYRGNLPEPGSKTALEPLFTGRDERAARIQADPVLAKGRPVDWSKIDPSSLGDEERQALRAKEHRWMRRMYDVAAPPGFDKVVARLDALVGEVAPVDWNATRYWGEEPEVYRVGVRTGAAFHEALDPQAGLDYLLSQAERDQEPVLDTSGGIDHGANRRVVDYWTYHVSQGQRLDAALPRIQAAWFRHVAEARREPDHDIRKLLLEQAREDADALKIDARKAEAALHD